MPDNTTGLRLVTVSFDDENGLEVDWDGINAYEAWAYLFHATELVESQLGVAIEEDED